MVFLLLSTEVFESMGADASQFLPGASAHLEHERNNMNEATKAVSIIEPSVKRGRRFKDISGSKIGRFTVGRVLGRDARGEYIWVCVCECGREANVRGGNLRNGHTTQCVPCSNSIKNTTHGQSRTSEYKIWVKLRRRCQNPEEPSYPWYGGRGILVSPEWDSSFDAFISSMGPRPSPEHTVERKNNALGYSSENCKWATRIEQARNKRSNRILTVDGVSKCAAEWGSQVGVSGSAIIQRVNSGWDHKRAIFQPFKRPSVAAAF